MSNVLRGCCFLMLAVSIAANCQLSWCLDKETVLKNVTHTYYNLKANGLVEFACQVSPDFDAAYKEIKMDTVGREQVLPAAKKIAFEVAVGPTGAASISHQFAGAAPTDEVAQRLQKVTEGMEHIVSGFFQTWSNLMINSPFSGTEGEYKMEEHPDGYSLTTDAGDTHVKLSLNRDLILTALDAKTPAFEGVVHPQFAQHDGGYVLKSYDASYKASGGVSQDLSVKIEYQENEGLPIPHRIELLMVFPQGNMDAPITFSNCKVKKK